uniref:Uncharacterized protein n=1 Tax=Zea mays TaxID=4577 RepID=A0A804R907_MAIZE
MTGANGWKAGEWCASKGDIPYFETSAKEDHNVDTAFLCMARLALEHEHDQDIYFKTVAEQFPETEQTSGFFLLSSSNFITVLRCSHWILALLSKLWTTSCTEATVM